MEIAANKNIIFSKKYLAKKRTYLLSESSIIFTISASIALPMVATLLNVILDVKYWDSVFIFGIYYLIMLTALYFSFKRIKTKMLLVPFLFLGLGLISFCMFPRNGNFLVSQFFIPFFTESLPLFLITLVINDYNRLYKALRIASIAAIASAFIFVIFQYEGKYEIDYMSFSYGVTLPVMLMLIFAFDDKKKIDLFFAFLGFTIIFVVGARGPILGLFAGVLFYFLINFKLNLNYTLLLISLVFLIIFFVINFENLIQLLDNFLQQRNISSRTVRLLLHNSIEHDSGRDVLYEKALIASQNLFIGNGMAGDRVVLGGTYAHNLFLEIFLEYGFILGTIFTIVLIYNLVRTLFFKNKTIMYYLFFAIFFTTGFIKLQFSSSYTLEPTFYIMLALAMRLASNNKLRMKRKYAS